MKNSITLIILCLLSYVTKSTCQTKILNAKREIKEASLIMNSKLPIKIDDITKAIIVNYDEKVNELSYYFIVENINASDIKELGIEEFIANGKISGIELIRNSPLNTNYLIAQLDFVFIYLTSNKKLICKYRITPEEYN
jgi:hypothetical protein